MKTVSFLFDFVLVFIPFSLRMSFSFLSSDGGSQNATLVVVLVVVIISSLKIPKSFLIRCGAQRHFAYTFALIFPTDYRLRFFKINL